MYTYVPYMHISLLITVSLVSLIFQNRCLAELMAGFDQDLTIQIPDFIDSLYVSLKVKVALFLAATSQYLFLRKTSTFVRQHLALYSK